MSRHSNLLLTGATLAALALAACQPGAAQAAPGVSARVTAGVAGSYTGSNPLGPVTFQFAQPFEVALAAGTGSGKADKVFSDHRTLVASASENLDLAGVLTDPFGAAITCVKVKSLTFHAKSTNVNDVVVGGAASNGFIGPFGGTTPTVAVPPGGFFSIAHPGAGWTVTAATGDLLKVLNGGGTTSVEYDVLITCASA
jgi:hypothetical protein